VKFDASKGELPPINVELIQKAAKDKDLIALYAGLLLVIADALDIAVQGGNAYVSIGLTRKRDAIVLTVKDGNMAAYATGANITQLSVDCERLT